MSHKDEAREWIDEAPATLHDAGLNADTAERAAMCVGLAQAEATLALVDALEAANEQARIANLIALGLVWRDEVPETGEQAIFGPPTQDAVEQIATALGIGGDA